MPVKAVTFSLGEVAAPAAAGRPDLIFVRCSVGRIGEEAVLQRDDADLAALAAADLAAATGVGGAARRIAVVTRWGGALPQYTVGHLDRVARIQASLAAPARAGRLRRGLRRGRHPGLHRHGAARPPIRCWPDSSRTEAESQGLCQ